MNTHWISSFSSYQDMIYALTVHDALGQGLQVYAPDSFLL